MENFFPRNAPPPDGVNVALAHKLCEIYRLFHGCLKLFQKQEKYSLGTKIENTIIKVLEFVLSAAYAPKNEKYKILRRASDKIDLLKYLIRFAYETKSVNEKKYFLLEEKVIEIGKMIGGWLKTNQ